MADAEGNDCSAASKLAVCDVTGLGLFDNLIVQSLEGAFDGRKYLIA